jgi:hypothetical protein
MFWEIAGGGVYFREELTENPGDPIFNMLARGILQFQRINAT